MKKITAILLLLFFNAILQLHAQGGFRKDSITVLGLMKEQVQCWNQGDIRCFMEAYWKSDSLKFIGKDGVTYGWNNTLARYEKRYPDKVAMGSLSFDIISVEKLGEEHLFVTGKWMLKRTTDNVSGHFSLIWKNINGKWCIVSDHSS